MAAVRANFQVKVNGSAQGAAQPAEQLLNTHPARQWRTIRWQESSRGWLREQFVAVR